LGHIESIFQDLSATSPTCEKVAGMIKKQFPNDVRLFLFLSQELLKILPSLFQGRPGSSPGHFDIRIQSSQNGSGKRRI
jgi:hypothetical protein